MLLKYNLKGPNKNIPALGQIVAWRRPGHKPLFEPIMVFDTNMHHSAGMS